MTAWIQSWFNYFLSRFKSDEAKETALESRVTLLEGKVKKIMATLADVETEVTKQTTVVQSAVTLLNGLSAQLKAALASQDPTAVQRVIDEIDANTAALAAGVAANTTP